MVPVTQFYLRQHGAPLEAAPAEQPAPPPVPAVPVKKKAAQRPEKATPEGRSARPQRSRTLA
jgi:hypothetical protein